MPGQGVAIPIEEYEDDDILSQELFLPTELDLCLDGKTKKIETYLVEKANVSVKGGRLWHIRDAYGVRTIGQR
jgi:hypothetical protein